MRRRGLTRLWQGGFIVWGVLWLANCQTAVSPTALAPPTESPQPTPTLAPTGTPTPNEWQTLYPGIERRAVAVRDNEGALLERLTIIRIDNRLNRFEVAYHPTEPKIAETWREALGALLVVNGGFFTPEYAATGLVIIDGVVSGQSYGSEAGMVTIRDGRLTIQDLAERPYSPDTTIDFALQSFPMLLKPGGESGYTGGGEAARRTVIGMDSDGRVLLIVAQLGNFSLAEMGQWLASSDLNLDLALNLDGGTSTSLAIQDEPGVIGFSLLPIVIAVYSDE